MVTTPEEARRYVESMGLPPVFLDVWDDKVPTALRAHWKRPELYFSVQSDLERDYPRFRRCVPLVELNLEAILAFDTVTGEYIECYYYRKFDDASCEVLADNYQGFAAAYLVDCLYAGSEKTDEIARLLEFKHLSRLKEWAEIEDESTGAREAKRRFVESIPRGR